MPVILNDNDNPLSWGKDERLDGEDIPCPPKTLTEDPDVRAKWDRNNEEWIEDPDFTPPPKYVVRRTTDTNYQLEDTTGMILLESTFAERPTTDELAEAIVTYAENNGDAAMHELRKIMLVGYKYVDSR